MLSLCEVGKDRRTEARAQGELNTGWRGGRSTGRQTKDCFSTWTAQCGARPMWVLCLNLILLDNQTDKRIAQSNYFVVKLAPHFWQGDERENKGMREVCSRPKEQQVQNKGPEGGARLT